MWKIVNKNVLEVTKCLHNYLIGFSEKVNMKVKEDINFFL